MSEETKVAPSAFQFEMPKERVENKPPILMVHGLAGVGKSQLASTAPGALFLFTENGQHGMKVRTLKSGHIESWAEFLAALDFIGKGIKSGDAGFKGVHTLVVDTVDHLEKHVLKAVADEYRVKAAEDGMREDVVAGIQSFADIPAKYNFDKWKSIDAKWEAIWKRIERLRTLGLTILGLCHSETRQVDDPNSDAPYMRNELTLDRKRAQSFWVDEADAVGFIYYPTVLDAEKGRTSVTKHPVISFKRSAGFLSKTNFGLGEYKLDKPEDGFMSSVGSVIPFFKQFQKKDETK